MRMAWKICFVLMCTAVLLSGRVGAEGAGLLAGHHVCDPEIWPWPPAPSVCFEDDCNCSTPTMEWTINCPGGGTPAGFEAACTEYCDYYFCGVDTIFGNVCVCNPVAADPMNQPPEWCACSY
jgi:hypothetical protein